jgi:hypothetical protein
MLTDNLARLAITADIEIHGASGNWAHKQHPGSEYQHDDNRIDDNLLAVFFHGVLLVRSSKSPVRAAVVVLPFHDCFDEVRYIESRKSSLFWCAVFSSQTWIAQRFPVKAGRLEFWVFPRLSVVKMDVLACFSPVELTHPPGLGHKGRVF